MLLSDDIEKSFRNEFVAFYEISELPDSWEEWLNMELDNAATNSAARMTDWVEDNDIPEMARLLRSAARERRGTLVRQIEKWTRFFWSEEDDDWNALQEILNAIANQLEAYVNGNQ